MKPICNRRNAGRRNIGRSNAGLTLIEVLATMVVMGIVSMGVTSLMIHSTAMISNNAQYSQAVAFAQQATEDLRAVPYDNMATGVQVLTEGATSYTVSSTVTDDSPAIGMKTIVVSVAWDNKGVTKSYALETVFTQVTS
jgi:prepilin-type N-terminal cleavage/methylation domain-containing protein